MSNDPIQLKASTSDPEMAYIYLPDHPKKIVPGIVKKQTRLADVIEGYRGPDVYLDFDKDGVLIGIEIT